MAKHTMVWSTYLNTEQYDYDGFKAEFDQIATHVKKMLAEPAPAYPTVLTRYSDGRLGRPSGVFRRAMALS